MAWFLILALLTSPISPIQATTTGKIYLKIVKANHINSGVPLYETNYPIINASAQYHWWKSKIVIHRGIIKFAHNNDQIAFVLGHEMAHIILKHDHSTWANEYAADRLGMFLITKAGYNGCKGLSIVKTWTANIGHAPGWMRYKKLCGDK